MQVANVLLFSVTTAVARHFLDRQAGCFQPFPWKTRAITAIGPSPADLWHRVHHAARSPQHRETFYKFLFNALPLGCRAQHFRPVPGNPHCHYCRGTLQTLRHFVFSCPLAQCVWRELRRVLSLPRSVSLLQATFSWSPSTMVLGSRYGFRLQAGHAVALHVLWKLHCAATYDHRPASIPAARAMFRADFLSYLEVLYASLSPDRKVTFSADWSPPLSSSSSRSPFALR
jgi:hypothetical protein